MTNRRKNQLQVVNSNLTKTITDYTVIVKYEPSGIIDGFRKMVQDAMRGSYCQDGVCKTLCQNITPQELAALIWASDITGIAQTGRIEQTWASEIHKRFFTYEKIFELQSLAKPPCPVIVVKTKSIPAREIR